MMLSVPQTTMCQTVDD